MIEIRIVLRNGMVIPAFIRERTLRQLTPSLDNLTFRQKMKLLFAKQRKDKKNGT